MKYRYIFGPIVSRRFGYSLGIDLSPDEKSCNFDCLYCELEKSKPVNFIKNQPKVEDIIEEVEDILKKKAKVDLVTITSNGEPTLYEKLDELVDELNLIKRDKKLLILTNSSTIMNSDIQQTLKKIDIVKFSLDAITQNIFRKIDRGHVDIEMKNIIEGIKKFKKLFNGELIIEILIVQGVNDKEDEMRRLNKVLNEIKPDRIDFGTIDRPPSYDVNPVSMQRLRELSYCFENLPIHISYKKDYKLERLRLDSAEIMATIKRRPLSQEDINISFDEGTKNNFDELLMKKAIIPKIIAGVKFYILNR